MLKLVHAFCFCFYNDRGKWQIEKPLRSTLLDCMETVIIVWSMVGFCLHYLILNSHVDISKKFFYVFLNLLRYQNWWSIMSTRREQNLDVFEPCNCFRKYPYASGQCELPYSVSQMLSHCPTGCVQITVTYRLVYGWFTTQGMSGIGHPRPESTTTSHCFSSKCGSY